MILIIVIRRNDCSGWNDERPEARNGGRRSSGTPGGGD